MIKRLTTPRTLALIVAGVAILSAGQMLLGGVRLPDMGRVLPLDEGYRLLQYAAQIGAGQPFQYNSGDAPTTGTTGLLYMLLLSGGFALGIGQGIMPDVVVWFNTGLFVISAVLITDLTRHAADGLLDHSPYAVKPSPIQQPRIAGFLAGVLWLGNGWLIWDVLTGTSDLLLITLLLATLWAFSTGRVRLTALFGVLAIMAGPAALLLVVLLLAAQLVLDPAEYNDRRRRFLWGCAPVAAGLLLALLTFFITGTWLPSGLLARSWLTMQPFEPGTVLSGVMGTALGLGGQLLGITASPAGPRLVFPLTLLLALVGMFMLRNQGRVREKRLALVCLGWLILGMLGAATLQPAGDPHSRALLAVYAVLIVPTAITLVRLGAALATVIWQRSGFDYARSLVALIGLGLLAIWIISSLAGFDTVYRQDVAATASQQMALAAWLRDNAPADAQVATAAPGAIRYSGERTTLDLTGATSTALLEPARHGPGTIYEVLEKQQPDYYAVDPDAGPPFYDLAVGADLLGEEVFRSDGGQVITMPDWSAVALAEAPQQPHLLAELDAWTRVDRLDVADLADEQAHAYQGQQSGTSDSFLTEPRQLAYIDAPDLFLTDGGRLLNGGATFTIQTPDPGQWLLLVARVQQERPVTLRVWVDGVDGGLWKIPALPETWLESAFVIRPELVRGTTTRISLQIEDGTADTRYNAFHYWGYQGERDPLPPAPGTISEATLGDVVRLRGFDLPGRIFSPGEDLPLTLHWEALHWQESNPETGYRYEVTLIDPQAGDQENTITQIAGVPRGGTRPFWTWQTGEAVSDDLVLAIPAETPPGEYLLLLAVVNEATGDRLSQADRLPIIGGDDWGDNRLVLGPITLR